jgi:LysR family transcriptional activator of nhaA
MVFRYANEIYSLGQEMLDALKTRPAGRPLKLQVGVDHMVPELVAHHLLQAAYKLPEPVQIACQQDKADRLLAALAVHELDLVLTDTPIGPGVKVRAYNHVLGECDIAIYGNADLADFYRPNFPRSLDRAPMLLPLAASSLRRSLDQWFESIGVKPQIVGEFDNSALLKSFALDGLGLCALPAVISADLHARYRFDEVGRIETIKARFYAISAERRPKHPAVIAITNAARQRLTATT